MRYISIIHCGPENVDWPFHLPSQQSQVNHALQVHLVLLGDLGPLVGRALLICPEKKYNNVTGSVIPMKTFSTWRIHTFVLTWGPTTPEGPGGPVFPWNPCSIENMEIKHVLMSFCVWGDKKNIFNQRPMTSLTGSPLWPGWPGSPSFPAGPYTQRHLVRNEQELRKLNTRW